MLEISTHLVATFANTNLVERIARMLVDAGTMRANADRAELHGLVAMLLEMAWEQGIRTERLLGMYVLIRCSDEIDPFEDCNMVAVLRDSTLAEDDKAHLLQMIRLGEFPRPREG